MSDHPAATWTCAECEGPNGERLRKKRNCDGTGKPVRFEFAGRAEYAPKCPCAFRREHSDALRIVAYAAHYRNGFLPVTGGISDQPNAIMDGILAVGAVQAEHDRHRIESARGR